MSKSHDNDDTASSQHENEHDEELRASFTATPSRTSLAENIDLKSGPTKILGVVYGIGMNVNNVLGSGIMTSPGIIWNAVKSPGIVLLLWSIGGIISMAGSLSYVELGVIHRISGGETKYLQTAFPKPKLMISYLFSFMFIFAIRPGILSAVLQSAAQYFYYTVKGHKYSEELQQGVNGWNLPFSPFWFIKLIAVTILFIITVYHMLSNRWANYINQTLAAIKVSTYSIIAIAGLYRLCSNEDSRTNWRQSLGGNTDITAYSTSILLIMFSYDGWNSLNYSLDEFRKPEKKLILSNSISVGLVTLIYLLVNVAFISVVPADKIINKSIDETIAATFFRQLFGESEVIVRIFTTLVVLSVTGTAASIVWGGSRVIVASAASDFFPVYSRELTTWHSYFNTPVNALFAQFIWCSLIIFFVGSSFTLTSFTLFSSFSMYSYWFFYFATGVGLLVIRYRVWKKSKSGQIPGDIEKIEERNESDRIDNLKLYKVPLPVAGIFILGGLFILSFSFVVDDKSCPGLSPDTCRIQQMSPLIISYAFLLIAIIFWYVLYCWWDTRRKNRNSSVIRVASDSENERTNIY